MRPEQPALTIISLFPEIILQALAPTVFLPMATEMVATGQYRTIIFTMLPLLLLPISGQSISSRAATPAITVLQATGLVEAPPNAAAHHGKIRMLVMAPALTR